MKKQIRVAISGSHGTGKTTMTKLVREGLEELGYTVAVVEGTTRPVKEFFGGWELTLYSSVLRRLRAAELAKGGYDVILSERCGLDESIYAKESDDPSPALVEVLSSIAIEEIDDFWDVVFYKPISTLHPIERDGVRPMDSGYQKSIDSGIDEARQMWTEEEFPKLPEDLFNAAGVIIQHVREELTQDVPNPAEAKSFELSKIGSWFA